MANQKPLYASSGTTTRLADGDGVLAAEIDRAVAGAVTIGGTTATSVTIGGSSSAVTAITIGKVSTTTTMLGNLTVNGATTMNGAINNVGTTTFTANATFNGNVTFGDASTDLVVFTSKVNSNMAFEGTASTPYSSSSLLIMDSGTFTTYATLTFQSSYATGPVKVIVNTGGFSPTPVVSDNSGVSPKEVTITYGADCTYGQFLTALATSTLITGTPSFAYQNGAGSGSIMPTSLTPSSPNATSSGGSAGGAAQYKITNLAAGSSANDAVIYSQISSLVTGVSSVSGSGGTTGLTLTGGPSGAVTLTLGGTLAAANGGTGFGASSNYVAGDLLYASGATSLSKLGIGGSNTVLRSNGSAPAWGSVALTTDVTGTLPVANGGTGATTLTGYISGNGTSAFTASNTIPGSAISGDISGNAANVTGTVAVANGGTGASTLAANNVLLGNGTDPLQAVAPGSSGNVLTSNGSTWQSTALPATTDYSVVAITTAQAANTAVTVGGAAAQANAASTARVAGIVKATNSVQVLGICTCIIEALVTVNSGDVVYLSASEAGKVTKTAPSTTGQVVAELGIATANGSGVGGTVSVLWQPKSITVL